MRYLPSAFVSVVLAFSLPASPLAADPGYEAERVSDADALEAGQGAVVLSLRSEIYLDEPLQVWFVREGDRKAEALRFERSQGFFAFGNDTLDYQVRTFALPAGTYRLIAHGMDCPKIPDQNERCLVDRPMLGGVEEVSRPSRGYGETAPRFEVQVGALTYAGDFVLTARNRMEWAQIPYDELGKVRDRFGGLSAGPDPVIPGEFRLRYALKARSYRDDAGRRY